MNLFNLILIFWTLLMWRNEHFWILGSWEITSDFLLIFNCWLFFFFHPGCGTIFNNFLFKTKQHTRHSHRVVIKFFFFFYFQSNSKLIVVWKTKQTKKKWLCVYIYTPLSLLLIFPEFHFILYLYYPSNLPSAVAPE